MKSEVIENLKLLVSSAKERNIDQGVNTFNSCIEKLNSNIDEKSILEGLYRELLGMQRFADFSDKEWQLIQAIINAIEASH